MNPENARLEEVRLDRGAWRRWGPYLSERQWGTVREDYSQNGDAWDYFSHDQARSRAYHWGEDGLAGISDDKQILCFAIALWNEKDPILKERLFGLTNHEGNHGEDCKEYYFYLDSTPTHSYMKYLYKYPQAAYPYSQLVEVNGARSRNEREYELLDTGVFNSDRYFDVFVEYAKEEPEDILIRITVWNRGPQTAALRLLPTLWFRNTWSWGPGRTKPLLMVVPGAAALAATHSVIGEYYLYCSGDPQFLFTENETNTERLYGTPNATRYVKDGIDRFIVHRDGYAVNRDQRGSKAAAHYALNVEPAKPTVVELRLTCVAPAKLSQHYPDADPLGNHFRNIFKVRQKEADEFYADIIPAGMNHDQRNVMRQALGGMLWSKQYYEYDLETWLHEHGAGPAADSFGRVRNIEWYHMVNSDIISMPDKWEYPWYAAWDLAFHTISLSLVDPLFARQQLDMMLREHYLHPNGQLPASEWNFSDVNPPVHAWACVFNHRVSQQSASSTDREFLEHAFQKLLMNFTWWVNRKDRLGTSVLGGGFLGLDNIGVFDRSAPLPGGGYLEQADGTAWMALFSQNMLQIAVELASEHSTYEELACKFFEHFLWIASAMNKTTGGREQMWDEEDGFFYDLLRTPDGRATRLKVRSMVGLLPLCASTVFEAGVGRRLPGFMARATWFAKRHPELIAEITHPGEPGVNGRHLLALLNQDKLRRLLSRMLDEGEFLSDYGIRSISRYHLDHPYHFRAGDQDFRVDYLPGESNSGLFGGNSNWRGPIWMPTNALLIRALLQLYRYYGDGFTVECPTGSGNRMNLFEVSKEIGRRMSSIFLKNDLGKRPVYGGTPKFQTDPHWRDNILFYEYFHGDNGAGIGASHQTGWTGIIARVMHLFATLDPKRFLDEETMAAATSVPSEPVVVGR
jgi:hypothetical protein